VIALQMSEVVLEDERLQAERQELLNQAHTRLEGGELFQEVALDVHGQFDIPLQSDLGFVGVDMLEGQVWSQEVIALEEGEYTQTLTLPEAYAIFKLEERTSGEEEQVHLLTITVPKITLENVVGAYLKEIEVTQYIGR